MSLSSGSLNGDIESLLSQASNTASNLEALDSKLDELELLISENSLALEEVSSTTISSVVSSSSGDPWDDYNWITLTEHPTENSGYNLQDYNYISTRVKSGDYYYGEASSLSIPDSAKLLLINGQLVNPDATGVVYSAPAQISIAAAVFKLTLSNRKITLSVVQSGALSSAEEKWAWGTLYSGFDFEVYYLEG